MVREKDRQLQDYNSQIRKLQVNVHVHTYVHLKCVKLYDQSVYATIDCKAVRNCIIVLL